MPFITNVPTRAYYAFRIFLHIKYLAILQEFLGNVLKPNELLSLSQGGNGTMKLWKGKGENIFLKITQYKGFQYILLIILFIIAIINFIQPVIRFDSLLLNNVCMIFVLLIPTVLMIKGLIFRSLVAKILNTLIWVIPCILGILLIPFIIAPIGFEQIKSLSLDNSDIVAYRTNGGATTSFGILVRQEKNIVPGIKLVKNVYSQDHKENVNMIKTGKNSFEIEGNPETVKRNVYFE